MSAARLAELEARKALLDQLRQARPHALDNLEHAHDLELTFSSTAIEGNTLTAVETTLVLEQGLTIGGKPLRDHLEVVDHHDALGWVRATARRAEPLGEHAVRQLHALVMGRSSPAMAGRYADQGRFVLTAGGRHAFPSPAEVPALMGDFAAWLAAAPPGPQAALAAHWRLVRIHPFNDGNGRTARLLMNLLLLLRQGWPPVAVRPDHRAAYLASLQGDDPSGFEAFLLGRLGETVEDYIAAASAALPRP